MQYSKHSTVQPVEAEFRVQQIFEVFPVANTTEVSSSSFHALVRRIFAYLMDLFGESHQQRVLVWRWAVKRALLFESAAICAGDDVANAIGCNYNPYFMVSLCGAVKLRMKICWYGETGLAVLLINSQRGFCFSVSLFSCCSQRGVREWDSL